MDMSSKATAQNENKVEAAVQLRLTGGCTIQQTSGNNRIKSKNLIFVILSCETSTASYILYRLQQKVTTSTS